MSESLLELIKKIADLDGDGKLTLKDLFILLGAIKGLINDKRSEELKNGVKNA